MPTSALRLATRGVVLFAFIAFTTHFASAQNVPAPAYKIAYRVILSQPETHLFSVEIKIDGLAGAGYVDFQMPRWSPGRYAVFDFAKNVQEVRASGRCPPNSRCGTEGKTVERLDTQTWRVLTNESDTITLDYRVFGDDLSGTFSQFDARHANFNGGSIFMYVVGHKQDPVSLLVGAPYGWKIFNAQSKREDQTQFEFPNYDLLIDTPTEAAPDFTVDTFEVGGKTYRVVVHSFGAEGGRRERLVKAVEKIVRAEVEMMGAPDFEQYTFLFHFDPQSRRGDGMEHLNSTQIIETGALADSEIFDSAIETAAHEFFHVWNVKRLRPVGLGPWDFTKPVVTQGLWIAEGFTNYYGKLNERRAGLWDDEQLLRSYAGAMSGIYNAPGNRMTSAIEASILAPFIDRSTTDQRTNISNTLVSYYPKGETLALPLDLLIRGRSKGKVSLDDVMRRAYEEFYLKSANDSYYLKGRGYTIEEFERVASKVAGFDLSFFFEYHVRGTSPPPYAEALRYVGLRLVATKDRRQQSVGIGVASVASASNGAASVPARPRVVSVQKASSAEVAGIKPSDEIVSIGGKEVTAANWLDALNASAGTTTRIVVRRGEQDMTFDLALALAEERVTYRIEKDDKATPEERALREAWLNGSK